MFKWSLGGALLAALGAELAPGGGGGEEGAAQERERLGARLSEKGVLQLLFDTRFLLDLLAGGRPVGAAG